MAAVIPIQERIESSYCANSKEPFFFHLMGSQLKSDSRFAFMKCGASQDVRSKGDRYFTDEDRRLCEKQCDSLFFKLIFLPTTLALE